MQILDITRRKIDEYLRILILDSQTACGSLIESLVESYRYQIQRIYALFGIDNRVTYR